MGRWTPRPQKEEPSPRKAGRGAAVRQRQQHTHKAAREEAEGALEGETACGSGGRGTGAGAWEEAGQGSGPHLPPLCLPSEGGSSGLREGAWRRKHCSDASSATFTASQVRSVAIKAKENVLFYDFL